MSASPRFSLLFRNGCHLCDEAAAALAKLRVEFEKVDIDRDDALRERYGDAIPVLLLQGREIGKAPLTELALRKIFAEAGVSL
jgi:glutaredoxin